MMVALNSVTGVLIRNRRAETQAVRRSHMEMEAETGGMRPHTQDHLEPPDAKRGGKEPPLEPAEDLRAPSGSQSLTWMSDFWSPGL